MEPNFNFSYRPPDDQLADGERDLLRDSGGARPIPWETVDPNPNGLDRNDLANLGAMLHALDFSGTEFAGDATIVSNDRAIKVRVWHDSELHRLEVVTS